ncbi:MAG: SoxR reducing system RseC family protein [Bacteroidales bacterium]|nr:SoxR reducing system RseC family protein [Bacteroidales bacterium]
MTEDTICKEGIVRAIHGDQIEVEITISSACSECHAKSICIPSDHKRETVLAQSLYNEHFEVGDKVHLVLKGSAGGKAVVLAYLLPFIVLMVALFGTYAITKSELAGVIVSVVFVVIYYIILKTQNKKIEQNFQFFVKRMEN